MWRGIVRGSGAGLLVLGAVLLAVLCAVAAMNTLSEPHLFFEALLFYGWILPVLPFGVVCVAVGIAVRRFVKPSL